VILTIFKTWWTRL
jgi:hypothetical protein